MPQPAPENATFNDYWIGDFDFISMDEFPDISKQRVVAESRPGVDGNALFLTGLRGYPTQVTTVRDVINVPDGVAAYANYVNAIGQTLRVMWGGNTYDHPFTVLDVERIRLNRTIGAVGGRLGQSGAILVCRWTLLGGDIDDND